MNATLLLIINATREKFLENRFVEGNLFAYLAEVFLKRIREKSPFYWMTAAGSTLDQFASSVCCAAEESSFLWEQVKVFLADERCVLPSDSRHNGSLVRKALGSLGVSVRGPDTTRSPLQSVQLYEKELQQVKEFDLITLGLGEDGHIASLLCGDPLLKETKKMVGLSQADKNGIQRISVTLPFLKQTKELWLIASGEKKKKVIYEFLEGSTTMPAANLSGNLIFWQDQHSESNA